MKILIWVGIFSVLLAVVGFLTKEPAALLLGLVGIIGLFAVLIPIIVKPVRDWFSKED